MPSLSLGKTKAKKADLKGMAAREDGALRAVPLIVTPTVKTYYPAHFGCQTATIGIDENDLSS